MFPALHREGTWNSSLDWKFKGDGVGLTLLSVTISHFPPLKEDCHALVLLPAKAVFSPQQDVLLSPLKSPIKGTQVPSLRANPAGDPPKEAWVVFQRV